MNCDDLTLSMVGNGLGHLFLIDAVASKEGLAAQRSAQERGVGMWAKGIPKNIVTSLHSAAESEDRDEVFNRIISTIDGRSEQVHHSETHAVCQEICLRGSCMVYVPYGQRFGRRGR